MKLKHLLLITVFTPSIVFGAASGGSGTDAPIPPPIMRGSRTTSFEFAEDPAGYHGTASVSFGSGDRILLATESRDDLPVTITLNVRTKEAVASFIEEYAVYRSNPSEYVKDKLILRKIDELKHQAETLAKFCFADEEIRDNTTLTLIEKAHLRALRAAYYSQYGGPAGLGAKIEDIIRKIAILSDRG